MQKLDECLYTLSNGQTGDRLEEAIRQWSGQTYATVIWGEQILVAQFLLDEQQAQAQLIELIKKHWSLRLLSSDLAGKVGLSLETVKARIHQFFVQSKNHQMLFSYTELRSELRFEQLVELLFGKTIAPVTQQFGLEKIYLHKFSHRYFIQPIYLEQAAFSYVIYAKKIYSSFLQVPLSLVADSFRVMTNFRDALQKVVTKNRTATILHKLVQKIDEENIRSDELKQLHLLNIRTHFTSGRRHFLKLKKCIHYVEQRWDSGRWALNEKEKILFAYMLLHEAVVRRDRQQVIVYGLFLIEEGRLYNYAVELVVEYSDVLNSMNPQPSALIKNYEANYLEYVFFVLVDALVEEEQFERAYELLVDYELATCTSIYQVLHAVDQEEELHVMEASIQQNIALLVDGSLQNIRDSITEWLSGYGEKTSPYFLIARQSSKHMSNILKILFIAEEDIVLDKLMHVYKKYVKNDVHLTDLREFIEERALVYE